MKQKLFKYNFLYYLAILYSISLAVLYFIIVFIYDGLSFKDGISSSINIILNLFLFVLFVISTILILKNSIKTFLVLNSAMVTLSILILIVIVTYYLTSGRLDDLMFFVTMLFTNVLLMTLFNKFKLRKTNDGEIDQIGKTQ